MPDALWSYGPPGHYRRTLRWRLDNVLVRFARVRNRRIRRAETELEKP